MSQINVNRKLFLELEELNRMFSFFRDNVEKRAVLGNTTAYGILKTDFNTNTDFLVENGTNSGTVKIARKSYLIDSDELLGTQESIDNIAIPNDSAWYWVRVSHKYRRHEVGTVSIDINGNVVGSGTAFTEVLRGQVTDAPTKIRFLKSDLTDADNSSEYEVVDVTDDLNLILTSAVNFSAESDLYYVVVGSTPIDEVITSEQREGLYKYDDCLLELVEEEVLDTEPTTGYVADKTFYIARVQNTGLILTIQDKRTNFWSFNIAGLSDKLDKANNLDDLTNKATARTNLGVYGKTDSDSRYCQSANNLSEVDAEQARTNLDVPSNDDLSSSLSNHLLKSSNLLDLPDKATARTNLGVYGKTETYTQAETKLAIGLELIGWCSVTNDGFLYDSKGDLTFTPSKTGTGQYTVVHNYGSTDYFITANTTSPDGVSPYSIKMGGTLRLTNSAKFWTGDDASANDAAFEFLMYKINIT